MGRPAGLRNHSADKLQDSQADLLPREENRQEDLLFRTNIDTEELIQEMAFFRKKKKKIDVMMTAFRDGFQSVYGARVLTPDFLPALAPALEAGITHFEAGGGARFQSLFFYCNENAFDMMDSFRETVGPEANLQTLARGVNVVGLDSQSSDIIRLHAQLFKKHPMTTIRNFDALNDVDNLDYSGRCIAEAGLKHEICISMMGLPLGLSGAHDPEFYLSVLQKILDAGIPFDSLCFKDASGTTPPHIVHETIKKARSRTPSEIPIRFHTHETAGISITTTLAALEAGATGIDCSMAPCSGGTGQMDIIVMWHALRGSDYDLGLDIQKLVKAEKAFKAAMSSYQDLPEASRVEPLIFDSPMPGGALTANTQMMRDNGILDRYPEVIENMAEVVKRGGFGTSVTPVSQFYFQQAFNNTMAGPWKKIAEGYGKNRQKASQTVLDAKPGVPSCLAEMVLASRSSYKIGIPRCRTTPTPPARAGDRSEVRRLASWQRGDADHGIRGREPRPPEPTPARRR